MKNTACLLFFVLLFSISLSSYTDSIYDLSVTTITGKTISLSSFKGKKILFVVLPLSSTDTILPASALKMMQTRYSSLVVIGIVSFEAEIGRAHV